MARMKGIPQKIGQHLTMKSPERWGGLGEIVTRGLPVPDDLPSRLRRDLGKARSAELAIDETPLAAGSVAQIYRGRLGGREVAIKVYYRGIERALTGDLNGAERSLSALSPLLPAGTKAGASYLASCLETLRPQLLTEVDGLTEASSLGRFADFFEPTEGLSVPRPIVTHSTRHGVVMDFVEGEPLIEALEGLSSARVRRAIGGLVRAWFMMAAELGELHADLHPHNILATGPPAGPETELTFIDLGQVTPLHPSVWAGIVRLIRTARRCDAEEAADALSALDFEVEHAGSGGGPAAHLDVARALCLPFLEEGNFDLSQWKMGARLKALGVTLLAPPHLLMAMRSLFGLTYHVKRTQVCLPWARLLDEFGGSA